jgi:hypothetical protein
MVKITAIRVIGLDTPGDGCVIRINTDAGLVGYRERGATRANGPFNPTLDGTDLRRAAKGYANIREAVGDDIDIALHLTGQFDTRSAIGLRTALDRGPADRPLFRSLARTQVFHARAPPRRRKGRDGRWLPAPSGQPGPRYDPPRRLLFQRHHRWPADCRLRLAHPNRNRTL